MTASPTLSILDRPAQATPARPITGGGRAQEPQLKREVSARARLHTPQFKRAVLKRTRLLAQLARERDRRVALVCAPAGFGKTILAAQLSAEDPRPSGWLHLDHADNDPVVLLNDLVEVLERLEPVASGLARELESPFPVIGDAILALLERDLVSRDPFVLVLDELAGPLPARCAGGGGLSHRRAPGWLTARAHESQRARAPARANARLR